MNSKTVQVAVKTLTGREVEITADLDYDYSPPETVTPEPGSSIQGRIPGEARINNVTILGVACDGEYKDADLFSDAEITMLEGVVADHFDNEPDRLYSALGLV